MSTRDELAELLDRIFYEHEGGYIPNEENVEYAQADALIAEGWRKKPSREEIARAIALTDDYDGCFERIDHWDALPEWEKQAYPEEEPHSDREDAEFWLRRADAILALMDRGQ